NNSALHTHIAQLVSQNWNGNNNCGLVVGATHPEELKTIRIAAPDLTLLIPGIGAQGGDLENTLINGLKANKKGLIISSSRGIIFAESPRVEAEKLRDEINSYR
nr:orotidine 5'-phosphate decarboxylase [Candidatus Levybacteria bacterium]